MGNSDFGTWAGRRAFGAPNRAPDCHATLRDSASRANSHVDDTTSDNDELRCDQVHDEPLDVSDRHDVVSGSVERPDGYRRKYRAGTRKNSMLSLVHCKRPTFLGLQYSG